MAKEASRLGESELAVTTDNDMHDPVFPNGCAVCEVEVDPETGLAEFARYSVVDDVGRCIKPLIVHGQTHGGVAQGVRRCGKNVSSIQPRASPCRVHSWITACLARIVCHFLRRGSSRSCRRPTRLASRPVAK